MSWFDSSFTFARTALSQAQKSIDKVLDIRDEQAGVEDQAQFGPLSSTASTPSQNPDQPEHSPAFSTSTPRLGSSKSTSATTKAGSVTTSTPSVSSPSRDDSFTSTWGGAESLWSSLTNSPKKTEQTQPVSRPERPATVRQNKAAPSRPIDNSTSSSVSPGTASSPRSGRGTRRSGKVQQEKKECGTTDSDSVKRTPLTSRQRSVPSPSSPSSPSPSVPSPSPRSSDSPSDGGVNTTTVEKLRVDGSYGDKGQGTQSIDLCEASAKTATVGEGDRRVDDDVTAVVTKPEPSSAQRVSPSSDAPALSIHHTSDRDTGGPTLNPTLSGVVGKTDVIVTEDRSEERVKEEGDLIAHIDTTDGIEREMKSDTPLKEGSVTPLQSKYPSLPPTTCSPDHALLPVEEAPQLSTEEETSLMQTSLSHTQHTPHEGDTAVIHQSLSVTSSSPLHPADHQPPISPPLPISHSPFPISPSPPTTTPKPPPIVQQSPAAVVPVQNNRVTGSLADTGEGEDGVREKKGGGKAGSECLEIPLGRETPLFEARCTDVVTEVKVHEGEREKKGIRTLGESVKQETGRELETVQQELERVQKLLEARETKMLENSREMIQLTEVNQDLQSRLTAAEEDLHTSQGGVEELRSEFTKRISTTEKKLQIVVKERDSLKKQLQVLTAEHSHQKKSAGEEMTTLLREKEEQITGLMEEGEKLSKKELQNSNIIKKLKEKNKQNDQLLTAQRQQIEDCEREMCRLKEVVKKKEENEKKYQESLTQLNSIAEQQEKELTALKSERDDLIDKARSLQTNLDNAYKELAELHKVTAVNKSVAHEALLSAEQSARQELTEVLEKNRVDFAREKEKLLLEISELRANVSRCEQQAAWREERMKQEVSDLQQRLQEAEMRNQELSTTISQTTKPFLRQIETLHSAHSTQTANWEKVEASLTQRLVDAQTQLSMAVEKERSAVEKSLTLQSRVTQLEKQTATLRQEKSRLTASLELEKAKTETLEESQQRDSTKMEAVRASLQQSLEELRKEKEMLERQLEYERVRLEAESRKACLESQEKERLKSQLANSLSISLSRQSSTASTTHTQSEILEKSLVRDISEGGGGGRGRGGSVDTSHYHGGAHPTSASALEQLQSLLKQKEGELANAQALVSSLERSRAAMANDLAAVSAQNSELTEKVETIPHLTTKLQELQNNNEALLQMYGEKAEQAEELKLDIQDLKEMYRQQIDALTKR